MNSSELKVFCVWRAAISAFSPVATASIFASFGYSIFISKVCLGVKVGAGYFPGIQPYSCSIIGQQGKYSLRGKS